MEKKFYDGYLINFSSSNGYPTIFVNGKNVLLHRYVYEKYNGSIPNGKEIHHLDKNKKNYNINNLILIDITCHHKKHAIENKLGFCNKGKPKLHISGFCGAARKIIAIKNDNVICFNSISESTRYFNLNRSTISKVLNSSRKKAYGWSFKYA